MIGPRLLIEDLRRRYRTGDEEVLALDGLDLDLPGGTAAALMGPSGSGKSTLAMILAGLDRPTSGRVLIGDLDVAAMSERALLRLRSSTVAISIQRPDRNLLGYGTAFDNLRFAQRGARRRRRRDLPEPIELLDRVGLARSAHVRVDRLSGGERQRLALAVGLATAPGLLVLDEPTSQLDARNRDQVVELLLDLHREHRPTLVAVTHDQHLADAFEQVLVMRDGRLVP